MAKKPQKNNKDQSSGGGGQKPSASSESDREVMGSTGAESSEGQSTQAPQEAQNRSEFGQELDRAEASLGSVGVPEAAQSGARTVANEESELGWGEEAPAAGQGATVGAVEALETVATGATEGASVLGTLEQQELKAELAAMKRGMSGRDIEISKIRNHKPELERIMRGVQEYTPGFTEPNDDGTVTTKRGKRENVTKYDFRRPYRVSRDRLRTLEALHDRLVKAIESWLVGRLRTQVDMTLESVEQVGYGDFTNMLETPCAAFIFQVHGSGGQQGVISVDMGLSFHLVDRLFGGDGRMVDMQRPLTKVERQAIRPLAERICSGLQDIWQGLVTMHLDIKQFEEMPDMLKTSARDESVLLATLNVKSTVGNPHGPQAEGERQADLVTGRVRIVLPFAVLDQFLMNTGKRNVRDMPGTDEERERARIVAEGGVRASKTVVACRLPEFSMTLEELAHLQVGDIVPTGISTDTPLRVRVGGAERYLAVPGKRGRRMGVKITAQVAEEIHWAGKEKLEQLDNEVTWLHDE